MRIVYDASAKPILSSPSLNECLQTGSPLQNLLWNVLIWNQFSPVALCGDIKQAFLQVRIKEEDQDAILFYWLVDKDPNQIETYWFTRALFGFVQSPFILGRALTVHLGSCSERYQIVVDEIQRSLYVDDVNSGRTNIPDVKQLKSTMIRVFGEANFNIYKWHSNMEGQEDNNAEDGLTYAKSQLGVRWNETKILSVLWDKATNQIAVTLPHLSVEPTKHGILQKLASCYDPVGLATPILLVRRSIYQNCSEFGASWDQPLPESYQKK